MDYNQKISKFNSSINEWQDSIYSYNKNYLNFVLFNKNKIVYKLLDNYFNLYSKNKISCKNINMLPLLIDNNLRENSNNIKRINNLIHIDKEYELNLIKRNYVYNVKRKKILINWKNKLMLNKNYNVLNEKALSVLSLKRVFVNIPNIKHTNNSVSILIYIFNKNKAYLKNQLRKLKLINKINRSNDEIHENAVSILVNWKINSNIASSKEIITNANNYEYNYYFLRNALEKTAINKSINFFFKRIYLANIYVNNYKFNYINLINLYNILYKIYEKKVKINITNIKYVYMENNIFVESITRKLNDRKKGVLRVLKKALKLIKIAEINTSLLIKKERIIKYMANMINVKKYTNYINSYINDKYKTIFKSVKNIHVVGISLEAKGRLTKRMTASRSVYKLKYKGNLKNIYSSYYKMSTVLLRGFNKSNISYVNKNSKNKNGSYGITSSLNTF